MTNAKPYRVTFLDDDPGNCGVQLLGLDCARKLGMEWSRPEHDWTQEHGERKGYIVLFGGTQDSAAVTILHETVKFYTIRHDVDWSDRKAGDERRISKQHVREVTP